jgi:cell division protein FtsQ
MPRVKAPRTRTAPRNSVQDRPAAWRMMLRRQRRLARPIAYVVAGSMVVTVVGMSVHTARSHAGGFMAGVRERLGSATAAFGLRVHDVVIDGRANTPEAVLNAAVGVPIGSPILGFSLDETRAGVESIPWIERATVERRLPGTVIITLQERRPYAIWQIQHKKVLVDREGQVVTNQDIAPFQKMLPLIVGEGAPEAAAPLLDTLRDHPDLAKKVQASIRVGERRWTLQMDNGTSVLLPEGHEVAAVERLVQLQQDHEVLDRNLAAIDMRLPDRLVFRPRPDAPDGTPVPPVPPDIIPATPVINKKPT